MSSTLVFPMAAHVGLAAVLYGLLTIVRAPAIWGIGRRADRSNPWASVEKRISANLSNQFEWPLFFHVACLLLIRFDAPDPVALGCAWLFVAGRIAHSGVQIGTTNVRLRGIVFMINFLAVAALWGLVLKAAA